jgi:hypothetical protein
MTMLENSASDVVITSSQITIDLPKVHGID